MTGLTIRSKQIKNRIEEGWDPVDAEYAAKYADHEYDQTDIEIVNLIEAWSGGLKGKRILDLGGGPGQYTLAFAQRGASVTWHDPSRRYLAIAERKGKEQGIEFEKSLGYLEAARKFADRPFDIVFSRICWYYCLNDADFASLVYKLVRPGGVAYIDVNTSDWERQKIAGSSGASWKKWARILSRQLYLHLGWKIVGYHMPPRGRIAALFSAMPIKRILIDYSRPGNDQVLFTKAQ